MFGTYLTKKFSDIYSNVNTFVNEYHGLGIPAKVSDANIVTLYYLLYGRYGNSTIANFDENQFKYRLFGLIFQYGPTWDKELQLQESLRNLTDEQLLEGSRAIYNRALNPNSAPTTEELDYISEQNVTKYKKSKLEGYALLMELLKRDVTEEFLTRFKNLFIKIVEPYNEQLYETDIDEEE